MVRTIYIILAVILSAFFALFSFDSESIPEFLIHLSPAFAVIIVFILSFRHPKVAAVIYGALAVFAVWFFSYPIGLGIAVWLAGLAVLSILKDRIKLQE